MSLTNEQNGVAAGAFLDVHLSAALEKGWAASRETGGIPMPGEWISDSVSCPDTQVDLWRAEAAILFAGRESVAQRQQ